MCSINHKLKAIYIHIPKNGGQYIEYMLHNYYGFEIMENNINFKNVFYSSYGFEIIEKNECLKNELITKNGIFRFCSMSEYFNNVFNMDDYKWKSYYKFTFTRNPYDKIFSAWKYCVKHNRYFDTFKNFIFTDFENFKNCIDFNNKNFIFFHGFITQYQQLIDKCKIFNIDFIGKFENLTNDFKIVLQKLGINNIDIISNFDKKINESNIYINSHPIYFYNEYDNSMIDRVNTLFFKDFITFNYKIYETTYDLHNSQSSIYL